jgi:hypothetical protein
MRFPDLVPRPDDHRQSGFVCHLDMIELVLMKTNVGRSSTIASIRWPRSTTSVYPCSVGRAPSSSWIPSTASKRETVDTLRLVRQDLG